MPSNKSLIEHYDLMHQQWRSNMASLQRLVDESLDNSVAFIEAFEISIYKEIYQAQTAIQENNKQAIVLNALNIAKRTNRIIQVATQEAENSEETSFVTNVLQSNEELKQCQNNFNFFEKIFGLIYIFLSIITNGSRIKINGSTTI